MKWNSAVMAIISSSMVLVLRLIWLTVRTLPRRRAHTCGVYLMPLSTLEILPTYALMRGPIYLVEGKFKTRKKAALFTGRTLHAINDQATSNSVNGGNCWCAPLFLPEYARQFWNFLPGVWDTRTGSTGVPVLLIAIAASDRDSVIYPLRKLFRQSPDLARALDILGMIDEILSFHRYSLAFGGKMVLPEIVEGEQHSLSVNEARNPLLARTHPDYVPNDILLDDAGRLLVITGPNMRRQDRLLQNRSPDSVAGPDRLLRSRDCGAYGAGRTYFLPGP